MDFFFGSVAVRGMNKPPFLIVKIPHSSPRLLLQNCYCVAIAASFIPLKESPCAEIEAAAAPWLPAQKRTRILSTWVHSMRKRKTRCQPAVRGHNQRER